MPVRARGAARALHQRQTANRSGVPDPERSRVVEESFPSAILAAMPIVAEEGDRVLVDATSFLLADTDVLPALKRARMGDWKQDVARSALNFDADRGLSEEHARSRRR